MYFGHYAVAVAIKAKEPDIPAAPLLLGTGFLDIMNGAFIVAGLDKVTGNLQASPYLFFDLTFIDWDHSLLMSIFWSLLYGLICWLLYKKNNRIAMFSVLVTFLHFVADLPMHNADMALYPHSDIKLGMGLWGSLGTWSWVLEIAFSAVLLGYAWKQHQKRDENIWMQISFITLLSISMSPWLSPMKKIAVLPESEATFLHGTFVFLGFIIPSIIFICMYKRTDRKRIVNTYEE